MIAACRALDESGDGTGAEQKAALFGKGPDCPPIGHLIDLTLGEMASSDAAQLHEHLRECPYCLTCFEAYQEAQASDEGVEAAPPEDSLLAAISNAVSLARGPASD
jgi:hypothetical protein